MTINTDDLLLFNSTLSNEYLELYNNDVLNIEELNDIRIKSLEYWGDKVAILKLSNFI